MEIQKCKETMTAKERVRRTFAFDTTDRVTIGYSANPVIHRQLCEVRGYHFAPTHEIQDGTPVENVIAMYNAAHRYGRY